MLHANLTQLRVLRIPQNRKQFKLCRMIFVIISHFNASMNTTNASLCTKEEISKGYRELIYDQIISVSVHTDISSVTSQSPCIEHISELSLNLALVGNFEGNLQGFNQRSNFFLFLVFYRFL
jgi:UDP-N-acetylmuramyl pentapeptide synthase